MSDMQAPLTANMSMQENGSDKVYNIRLTSVDNGWVVMATRGRRGTTLITEPKTGGSKDAPMPVSYEEAVKVFNALIKEKTSGRKGYTLHQAGAEGVVAPVYQPAGARERTDMVAMLPRPIPKDMVDAFMADDGICVQEKFNGRRMPVKAVGGVFIASNRYGEVSGYPVDVERSVLSMGRNVVLDGEGMGEHLQAFDIMELDDRNLRKLPYHERLSILASLYEECPDTSGWSVVRTAFTADDKRALHDEVMARGGEGIVMKHLAACYVPGDPAGPAGVHKLKFTKMLTAIVGAVNTKRSVRLELFDDQGNRVNMGNVTVPPNQEIPAADDLIEVEYLFCMRGGKLNQTVLLGLRDDVLLENCTMEQVEYKDEAKPTVAPATFAP